MKKLFILLALLVAFPASGSLYNYYSEQGLSLPSVQDRVSQATECDISDYTGTYEQNIKLEQCLRNKAVLGSATSTITTPTPGLKTNNTWLGTNIFNATTTLSGNNILATTTLTSTTVSSLKIGNTSTEPLINNSDASNYHYHTSIIEVVSSTNLRYSADTERSNIGQTYSKVKEIKVKKYGTMTVKVDLKTNMVGFGNTLAKIYINGSDVTGLFGINGTAEYITYSKDISSIKYNDLIQLYIANGGTDCTTYARNFRLYFDDVLVEDATVITD